ncbi:MAG: MASE1 domain-containing protein [Nitriliruptoraceae bacterium]
MASQVSSGATTRTRRDLRGMYATPIALVGAAYVAAGLFASAIQDVGQVAAIYWPAAGIAVGGLLILPRQRWPVLLAVLLALQLVHGLLVAPSIVSLVVWPVANLIGHLSIAMLGVRWGAHRLRSARDVMVFLSAALVGSVPAGLLGGTAVFFGTPDGWFAAAAATWFIGDVLGVLTVTPCMLLLGGVVVWRADRTSEVWASVTLAGTVTTVLFLLPPSPLSVHLSWLVVLPLIWTAVRTRLAGAALGIVITTFVAVAATAFDRGPFADPELSATTASVVLHLFLAGTTVTALVIASRTAESEAYQDLAEAREHLLAAVSHELRTPLTPIVGFSELLLDADRGQELDDAARDGLEIILRNGRHLTAMINDLLMFSRAHHPGGEPGRDRGLRAQPRTVDLTDLITQVLRERPDRADVAIAVGDRPVLAFADPTHVERIVVNLLDNATKYGASPIIIALDIHDRRATIRVHDRGPGVPDWFIPHLFDAFSQEVTGDTRPTIGLGLGLAICRDLAIANEGALRYEPAEPGGATFVLELPVAIGATRDV